MADNFVTKDSGERQVYSTGMVRDSGIKTLRPDLVDQELLRRWAELMGRGAVKYGENNWKKAATKEEFDRFRTSAYRHFFQWYNGLETSEDHAAAVCFNLAGAEMVKGKLDNEIPKVVSVNTGIHSADDGCSIFGDTTSDGHGIVGAA